MLSLFSSRLKYDKISLRYGCEKNEGEKREDEIIFFTSWGYTTCSCSLSPNRLRIWSKLFVNKKKEPGLELAPGYFDLLSTAYFFRHPCTKEEPIQMVLVWMWWIGSSLHNYLSAWIIKSGEAVVHCMYHQNANMNTGTGYDILMIGW